MENNKDRFQSTTATAATLLDLMIKGQLINPAISLVTKLKITEYLKDGPKNVLQLSEKTNCNPSALYRLLRMLSSVGIFSEIEGKDDDEEKDRQFKLTTLAYDFSDEKNIVKNMSQLLDLQSFKNAINNLSYSIESGKNAFQHVNNLNLFDFLQQNKDDAKVFNNAMTAMTTSQLSSLSSIYDFSQFNCLADIGGGQGSLLLDILNTNSKLNGILFDLPFVIESIQRILNTESGNSNKEILSSRCRLIAGDFFKSFPFTADGIIIKNVVLNWDDKSVMTIFKNCLQSIQTFKRENPEKQNLKPKLIIIDIIMPEKNDPFIGSALDILMLILTHSGRIRTKKEFSKILENSGFHISKIKRVSSDPLNFISIIEAIPSSI